MIKIQIEETRKQQDCIMHIMGELYDLTHGNIELMHYLANKYELEVIQVDHIMDHINDALGHLEVELLEETL